MDAVSKKTARSAPLTSCGSGLQLRPKFEAAERPSLCGAFPAGFRVARPPPGPIRPRATPPLSLHLNYGNYCAIISRALIWSRQGGYMVHAARASAPGVATPPCSNQSLAKQYRKPMQLTENKH